MSVAVAVALVALVLATVGLAAALAWNRARGRFTAAAQQAAGEAAAAAGAAAAALGERLRARDEELARSGREIAARDARLREQDAALAAVRDERAELAALLVRERDESVARVALVEEAQARLVETFKAVAADALRENNASFLTVAEAKLGEQREGARGDLELRQQAIGELLLPVRGALERVEERIRDIEKERVGAYHALHERIREMGEAQHLLRAEAGNLTRALRAPAVRGRWGEMQLRRVVELADMLDHCDFFEQPNVAGEDARYRPDMIVRLPARKQVVVDAKTPLSAYLEAIDATDDTVRRDHMREHARQIRGRLEELSQKRYWEQLDGTPELVILFLPGESIYSAALEHDPSLLEAAVGKRVLLATPTSLIAMLLAISQGWREERLADNARRISEVGADLYKRLTTAGSHFAQLGGSLGKAVESYNQAIGSLERRVLVSARKLRDLGVAGDEVVEPLAPVEQAPRSVPGTLLFPDLDS